MTTNELPPHVSRADGDEIEISAADAGTAARLARLGFRPHGARAGVISRPVAGEADKARLMAQLRDAGISFVRGREWSPAEVYEWLRDREMLEGPFCTISWTRPGIFHVRNES